MLTVTEEAREYLHALMQEVAGRIPAGICLRLDLHNADEASILVIHRDLVESFQGRRIDVTTDDDEEPALVIV